ncbi:MAG: site-specific integrase [Mycobacteriales bacterium]
MGVCVSEAVARADVLVGEVGYSPSTMSQYRWAWSQVEEFCSRQGVTELTNEVVASFLGFVTAEQRAGRCKEWKRKLLRRAVLVLSAAATTGSYTWKVFRATDANDGLNSVFAPLQRRYEDWLSCQGLARATAELYATVARTVLAWLPEREVTDVARLAGRDVSAAVVFLGGRYQPGSMRTALTALRVLCRFLEETDGCVGLSRAVPSTPSRRVRTVSVLPAGSVEQLLSTPDPTTPVGRRNRAILLLAARTGLRPSDIAGLRTSDIDWRQSVITLTQHKTQTRLTLPLLADVGAAIADYLLHGRPPCALDDHVFLRSQAPHVAFRSTDLRHVVDGALADAGIATTRDSGRGMRLLRASLATRMLENDTPLPVISQALGHRGIDSAKHYLAADETGMRQCCLDFAGIEPVASTGTVRA